MKLLHDIARWSGEAPGYNKGGGTTTTTTGLDPEIKKAVLPVIEDMTARYKAGDYGAIAGSEGMESALDRSQDTADRLKAVAGGQLDMGAQIGNQEGRFGEGIEQTRELGQSLYSGTNEAANRAMKNLQGNLQAQAAGSGSLTSARGQRAMSGALADRALEYQQLGAQTLSGLSDRAIGQAQAGQGMQQTAGASLAQTEDANLRAEQARKGLAQEKLDAPYQEAARYTSLLSGTPQGQTQTQTGGGK